LQEFKVSSDANTQWQFFLTWSAKH